MFDDETILATGAAGTLGNAVLQRLLADRVGAVRIFSPDEGAPLGADYAAEKVSQKMVQIVLSYTDFVRRRVWRQPA